MKKQPKIDPKTKQNGGRHRNREKNAPWGLFFGKISIFGDFWAPEGTPKLLKNHETERLNRKNAPEDHSNDHPGRLPWFLKAPRRLFWASWGGPKPIFHGFGVVLAPIFHRSNNPTTQQPNSPTAQQPNNQTTQIPLTILLMVLAVVLHTKPPQGLPWLPKGAQGVQQPNNPATQ